MIVWCGTLAQPGGQLLIPRSRGTSRKVGILEASKIVLTFVNRHINYYLDFTTDFHVL